MIFQDRTEAGAVLSERLAERRFVDPIILAIPRGGVVVGSVIARRLGAALDVVLARKLRSPIQPELALGAVSEDGRVVIDPRLDADTELKRFLHRQAQLELEEIRRRVELYRAGRPGPDVAGRSVIVVDDGIATGSTAMAAIITTRDRAPREIVLATPVMPAEHEPEFRRICDEVVSVMSPDDFWAIGQFYRDFSQVPDSEVVRLLEENRRERTDAGM